MKRMLSGLLQAAILISTAYLIAIELTPPPSFRSSEPETLVILNMILSVLAAALAVVFESSPHNGGLKRPFAMIARKVTSKQCVAFLNIAPVCLWITVVSINLLSSDCSANSSFADNGEACQSWTVLLDSVGLVTCRLARLDMGLCLLLAARGWLYGVTGGQLAYPEGMPMHRVVGWWVIVQSSLHSLSYLIFYLAESGWSGVLRNCFPALLPNTLGLVNFFGVVAFVVLIPLALFSLPYVRHRWYEKFQLFHLPLAMLFVVTSALHDLPILYFCFAGLAAWYFGRYLRGGRKAR